MRLRRALLIAGVAALGLGTALVRAAPAGAADARPHLTWVMAAVAPIHVANPGDPPGYADETRDWFIAHMPGFQHDVVTANSKRLQDMIAAGDGVCGAAMFKTPEREEDTLFSRPVYWTMPNQLVVSARRAAAIDAHVNERGEVDLPALLADRAYVGGVQFGRSYSPEIDRTLAEAEAHAQARPGSAGLVSISGPGHFDMLASGRFDWTIGFPMEVQWWARRLAGNVDKTNFLTELGGADLSYRTRPIAGSTGLVAAYIGCSKRPVGQAAIAAIDRLVADAGANPPWLAYYLSWLDARSWADYLKARATLVN